MTNAKNCGEIETISLLLYNCNTTKIIWESLKTWLQPLIREEVHIDEVSCILGNKKNTVLTNYRIYLLFSSMKSTSLNGRKYRTD